MSVERSKWGAILRGPTSYRPMLHAWALGEPWNVTRTPCGLSWPEGQSWRFALVYPAYVSDTVPRCRRCWP